MAFIQKIAKSIWKLNAGSNVYFLDFDEKIIIDTGERKERRNLEMFLSKIIDFSRVSKVIFTHLHYDHVGNFDLFPNAQFFASRKEIAAFQKNPKDAVLDESIAERLKAIKLNEIGFEIAGLKVIETPGHTAGSICLWHDSEKILFSGDTLFDKKMLGRTDLPTSSPGELNNSMLRLLQFNYKILCPGHDY